MEIETVAVAQMPDFSTPQRGFHHTVHTALKALEDLGISPERVTIRMVGRGLPDGWVVNQIPQAGTRLTPEVSILLSIAGLGFYHSLPVGLWDQGGEAELGTREIVEVFDDPIQKVSHWIREGARLFDLQDHVACSRWISLFGLNPENWPKERWHGLALLLPALHRLAGKEEGVRLGLRMVFDLPLAEIRSQPAFLRLEDDDLTLLSAKASRLGVDFIVGDRAECLARHILVIGPVPLSTYYLFQEEAEQRQLKELMGVCTSFDRSYSLAWVVLDQRHAPRLGIGQRNARLGINSYLGTAA